MQVARRTQSAFLAAAIATAAFTAPQTARADDLPCLAQESLEFNSSQPVLVRLRTVCPLLGNIVEEFALQDLGEAFPSQTIRSSTPEIATVAAFAAAGDIASMKQHAQIARQAGATPLEFKEMLYLTVVNAGLPKAIEATRALSDVLSGREKQCEWRTHHTL
jgi:4-carboxymuconolactone decarboxylase